MTLVDAAVYRDGRRVFNGSAVDVLTEARSKGGMAWVGLYRPDVDEMREIAQVLGLGGSAGHLPDLAISRKHSLRPLGWCSS